MSEEANVVKELCKGDIRVRIMRDEYPDSPRTWGPLGTMVCFHRRYQLGDDHTFSSPEDFDEWCKDRQVERLPLYLLDHSGISISTRGFGDRWDSGQVGWVYVTHEKIIKDFNLNPWDAIEETIPLALKVLKSEVEEYDKYLRGDVYEYIIEKIKSCPTCSNVTYETIEQVSGIYDEPDDILNNIILEYPKLNLTGESDREVTV